jgi:hypothetical protein
MDDWSSAKLCDVGEPDSQRDSVLFALAVWPVHGGAVADRIVVGPIIAVLSIAALAAFAVWEEWLNLIAGLALIVSPWLLGFQDSDAMTIDVVIGVIVALLAAFEVWLTHGADPDHGEPLNRRT